MKFLQKHKIYIPIASAALLGLALVVIPNGMRFTGFFLLGLAVVWLLGLALNRWAKRSRTGKICNRIFLAGLIAGICILCTIETMVIYRGEMDNAALPADAVIVLGAGVNGETPSAALWTRIRAAAAYLSDHPNIPVVLSGGKGSGENISEAEAMRRALWSSSEAFNARLLLEEQSTNTSENFSFSKALLEESGIDTETAYIAVVTNDFHCFRARMIAQREGLHTISVPAELPWWWLTANYYLREAFAVVKTALLDG